MTHEKWGVRPEQFPFQTFVNSSDYQSYIWFLLQRKSQKQGRKSYQKNNPYLPQNWEKGRPLYMSSHQKKNIVFYLFILWEPFEKPCLKKSIEKPTEFHGVMRRIVICCWIHTGGSLFFVQTRLSYQIQLRAFFIGQFATLEFTPASSPFLSSHRQVRHSWVHIGKLAIIVPTGKVAILVFISARLAKFSSSYRQDSPSFEFISARFARL